MFSLILYEPEIPPNTGNIIRLCANTGVQLHLIEPLGFELDEPRLKRAGLDYREFATVLTHKSLAACLDALNGPRVFALSTRSRTRHDEPHYREG
ncbi:MAG: tRNA (uridine(34)/cytosine(34)/5-carboxymethylaminomethyluridine(34)-2'-O)-methyltransferase TrmL, partial [Woeseiaceae bacterium]|nr:tRNA (uridine(34)/cytosine(34)/5-carboxymethylaminomethyluridine(34)-2'-O)-methyltransferase TrmL [Woeseiaceae bacterium]